MDWLRRLFAKLRLYDARMEWDEPTDPDTNEYVEWLGNHPDNVGDYGDIPPVQKKNRGRIQ